MMLDGYVNRRRQDGGTGQMSTQGVEHGDNVGTAIKNPWENLEHNL
jgi:hypothetical protein